MRYTIAQLLLVYWRGWNLNAALFAQDLGGAFIQPEHWISIVCFTQQSLLQQCTTEAQPFVGAQIPSDAISGKLIMAQVTNSLRIRPAQDIDNMPHPEALLRPIYAH